VVGTREQQGGEERDYWENLNSYAHHDRTHPTKGYDTILTSVVVIWISS